MKKLRLFVLLLILVILGSLIPTYGLEPIELPEPPAPSEPEKPSFIVCIDPGHQAKGDGKSEAVAPGSGQRKARVSSVQQASLLKKLNT